MRPSRLVAPVATVSHAAALLGARRARVTPTPGAGRPRHVSSTWVVMGERSGGASAAG